EKEMPAAKERAEKAVSLDGSNPLARYIVAQVAMDAGDLKAAREAFEALRAAGNDSYGIRLALGQIAAKEDQVDPAVEHLNAAEALDHDQSEPYALPAQL